LAYFLYILFFISCIILITSVLLQPGKTDAGALFTSNISSTAFQPRGAQTILSKMTIVAATTFMLSALLLAMPALTGNISVLQTNAEATEEAAPAVDTNSNTSVDTNTNAIVDANSNTTINANVPSNTAIVVPSNSNVNAEVANK
jgi:preprotein translocase subunit SecG